MFEHAIGERLDGSPLPDPNAGKNPAAVALGRLGGAKGGTARGDCEEGGGYEVGEGSVNGSNMVLSLTNAFSKRVENHAAAIALYFTYYNFGRIHQTLRVTPAMEAGVANHVWSVEEIVGLLG